jgi:hypothetical protein
MHKAPYVFPIVGGRRVEHLHANIEALDISLSPEQMTVLDNIVPFRKGPPFDVFVSFVYIHMNLHAYYRMRLKGDGSDYNVLMKAAGHFDNWPAPQPIRPGK